MKLKLKNFENYSQKWRKVHLSMDHYIMKKNIYYLNILNLKLKIPPEMEKGPSFNGPLYYTDSKLRIFSSFRPKNSSFCSMCYSYILSSSFGLDRITTNR